MAHNWKMPPLRHRASESHPSPAAAANNPNPDGPSPSSSSTVVPFGRDMRRLFNFAPDYTPLNHGSFGTYPRNILEHRTQLLRDWEARECIYNLQTYPVKLRESRAALAPLLGAHVDEVVLVPNATTGVNAVLRSLVYDRGDLIVFPATVYDSCEKTVRSLEESTPVRGYKIGLAYPIEDHDLVELFRETVKRLAGQGYRVRVAVFDTIVSKPGVRVPWERMVEACRELGVLSLIDGAHAIGHIDMTHTGRVKPDFLVSNCHKWLFTPRGCAVLYVPFANHGLITTALPTSHGYAHPSLRGTKSPTQYFTDLFYNGSTLDVTPYLTIPEALRFRDEFCGGETAIRDYCSRLAREAGDMVATSLGTEVLDNKSGSLRRGSAFANVRLPITVILEGDESGNVRGVPEGEVARMLAWFYHVAANDFDTYLQTFYYGGAIWTRLSAQVYLDMSDFVWAAGTIKEICVRVRRGEWRSFGEQGT